MGAVPWCHSITGGAGAPPGCGFPALKTSAWHLSSSFQTVLQTVLPVSRIEHSRSRVEIGDHNAADATSLLP